MNIIVPISSHEWGLIVSMFGRVHVRCEIYIYVYIPTSWARKAITIHPEFDDFCSPPFLMSFGDGL